MYNMIFFNAKVKRKKAPEILKNTKKQGRNIAGLS